MKILILYNQPSLPGDDPDAASEAGVLESVEAVSVALHNCEHDTHLLALANSVQLAAAAILQLTPVDVVVNLFEGLGGVGRGEAEIAGLVELCGHALTGSPADCLALVRDKARTKWLLAGAGIATPEFVLVGDEAPLDRAAFEGLLADGRLIVKPAHEDASLGISLKSIVDCYDSLVEQIELVRARYGPVLVERFISGREFNAGVLALPHPEVLPLAEIEFGAAFPADKRIVTYDAKWAAESDECLQTPVRYPADVSPSLTSELRRVALAAFTITGCRDYARVDMRVNDDGRVYVLEVNGNPDIGPTAGYARALQVAGIEYDTFIDRLVRTTHATRSRSEPTADAAAPRLPTPRRRKVRRMIQITIVCLMIWALAAYLILPLLWRHYEHHPELAVAPKTTETSNHIPGDPLNVTLIGSKDEVIRAFLAAGWYPADPITLKTSLEIAEKVLRDKPYPTAPVSSLFVFGRKQDLAFERPAAKSPKQREHVRFWKWEGHLENGRQVWLGAATFDHSVGLSHYTGQITHHIAPDVDDERDRMMNDLANAGQIVSRSQVTGLGPTLNGHNGGGDRYFTDGEVEVGVLSPENAKQAEIPQQLENPPAVKLKNRIWGWLRPWL